MEGISLILIEIISNLFVSIVIIIYHFVFPDIIFHKIYFQKYNLI